MQDCIGCVITSLIRRCGMSRLRFLGGASLAALCFVAWSSNGNAPAQTGTGSSGICVTRAGGAPVPATMAQWAEGAQIFGGLGSFHRPVTTASPEAQAYFDQGMRYLWAFNHDESTRSFAKAVLLDPTCAACLWGVALTVGPNYNLPMMAEPRA